MAVLQGVLGIAYPILIFFALDRYEPRLVALVVLGLLGLRLLVARPSLARGFLREAWLPIASVAAVGIFSAVWNDAFGLLLTPVLINTALLLSFGASLFGERPMVERFARLQVDDLTPPEIVYCRRVTQIWCLFFILNGGIALGLAWSGQIQAWVLFTGLISYLLIGLLFSVEYLYRHWRFRRYVGGFADPWLKRLFPPHAGSIVPPGQGGPSGSEPR